MLKRSARGRGRDVKPFPAVEQVLAQVLHFTAPADGVLRTFFRANPALGRRDRAAIAETVFDVLRNRRLYAHLAQAAQGPIEQRLVRLSEFMRAPEVPPRGDEPWLERARGVMDEPLSRALRTSLPDWFDDRIQAAYGESEADVLAAALLQPAGMHLRVNALKAEPAAALERLRAEGLQARLLPWLPGAIELEGRPALERSACFLDGWVEVQDAGSQLLARMVGARRGQSIVDVCAGAGGKTLALAAAMRSTGQIFACDVSVKRLQRLRPRLVRSGASNVQPFAIDSLADPKLDRLAGRVDAVLVDAPCSGSGTLRRNPDLKWRIQAADVERLVGEQRAILAAAARLVKPGGVLVFGTCSLLPEENEANVAWFEAGASGFEREDASVVLEAQGVREVSGLIREGMLRCLPHRHGTDGFFGVRWRRAASSTR